LKGASSLDLTTCLAEQRIKFMFRIRTRFNTCSYYALIDSVVHLKLPA
jgi:hypothetical protein